MGKQRFRLSSIFPTSFWLSRKSTNSTSFDAPKNQRPKHYTNKQFASKKLIPKPTFDEMLLLTPSSRSFRTEHSLPHLTLSQPNHSTVSKSSNSDESPTKRKMLSKCCYGVRIGTKSTRITAVSNNALRTKNCSPSMCSSSTLGSGKMRNGLSKSSMTTVVKSSANPENDFKESMLEMIVENNIIDLDGLEELLVSYLVLNSEEFHEVIVSVFKDTVIGMLREPNKCIR